MFWSPGWWVGQALTFLARFLNDYAARKRAEAALRDLGATTQAAASRNEAERQEAIAKAAGAKAAAAPKPDDDPDMRD